MEKMGNFGENHKVGPFITSTKLFEIKILYFLFTDCCLISFIAVSSSSKILHLNSGHDTNGWLSSLTLNSAVKNLCTTKNLP